MINLNDIQTAHTAIQPYVRRTPFIAAAPARDLPVPELYLKLENLQVTGSFKARGATNKVLRLPDSTPGLVTASGGNHGLGVAYAGSLRGLPVTIYLPHSTPEVKAEKLRTWGAQVIYAGEVWDDANAAALAAAEAESLTYVHPFADEMVIAGQGTIGLEMLDALPALDVLIIAIGGGGLIAGISTAVKALMPQTRVIGVEPTGAPTLYESRRAGRLIELDAIATAAGTLAPRRSAEINFTIIEQHVDDIVLVTDEDMQEAARWLWRELGIAAELSGAASVAALRANRHLTEAGKTVGALICGVGTDGF